MKVRKCVTIDADLIRWIEHHIKRGKFANFSHGFEYCIRQAMQAEQAEQAEVDADREPV